MANKTTLDATGCHYEDPTGTDDDVASLYDEQLLKKENGPFG